MLTFENIFETIFKRPNSIGSCTNLMLKCKNEHVQFILRQLRKALRKTLNFSSRKHGVQLPNAKHPKT